MQKPACARLFPSPYGMMFSRKIVGPLLAVTALLLAGCEQPKKEVNNNPAVNVKITAVQQRDVPVYSTWVGSLDGLVNAQIRAQISGYLLSQNYTEGSMVKKGEPLFSIDPRTFEAALAQAKGALGQAQASLGQANIDVARYTPLVKSGAVSQRELDTALQQQLSAQADVQSQQAAVQKAQLNVDFCSITSPIDGIAGLATAQVGDLISPSNGVLTTVSQVNPIKCFFEVSEQDYLNYVARASTQTQSERTEAKKKWSLELILANGEVYPHPGKFIFINRQVDLSTGALKVEAQFPNDENILRPGQFAKIRARTNFYKGALVVPQKAVGELQGSAQVAVVGSDNRVTMKQVVTDDQYGQDIVISSGLEMGENIVVDGIQKVRTGSLVNPTVIPPPKNPTAEEIENGPIPVAPSS